MAYKIQAQYCKIKTLDCKLEEIQRRGAKDYDIGSDCIRSDNGRRGFFVYVVFQTRKNFIRQALERRRENTFADFCGVLCAASGDDRRLLRNRSIGRHFQQGAEFPARCAARAYSDVRACSRSRALVQFPRGQEHCRLRRAGGILRRYGSLPSECLRLCRRGKPAHLRFPRGSVCRRVRACVFHGTLRAGKEAARQGF